MYIGNDLQIAHPSYKIIDDISSGFNGSTTSFALQVSGATPVPFPISTQQVMISVNGVVQEPDPNGSAGFKLLGSNIVFSSAPANGHAFFGVINAGADYVTAGSEFPDGSATAPSFTFQDDQDTGWYRNASGDVGYSSNGTAILNFDGNGLTIAAGKGLTVDTSTLHVDATNNRVGIGTTSPGQMLHIKGDTPYIKFEDDNDNQDWQIEARAFFGIYDATNSAFRLRLDSAGRLLLGTDTEGNGDADDLTIATSGRTGITIRSSTSEYGNIFFSDGTSGADEYRGSIQYYHSNNSLILKSNAVDALTLDSSQNATFAGGLSLSATTQNTHLGLLASSTAINFSLGSTSGTSPRMYFYGTGNGQSSAGDVFVGSGSGGILHFRSAESIKFEVDSDNTTAEALSIAANKNATFAAQVTVDGGFYVGGEVGLFNGSTNAGRFIDCGLGDNNALTIRGCSGGDANHETLASFTRNAGVVLAFDNVTKFQTTAAGVTVTGTVSDSKGNLRSIPLNSQTSNYTLVAADAGKMITTAGNSPTYTIPASVFSAGDAISIVNDSGSDVTLTQGSGLTLYNSADASTGNRTVAARGMITIYFINATGAYISGAGLS
jgi:hypothetical protein